MRQAQSRLGTAGGRLHCWPSRPPPALHAFLSVTLGSGIKLLNQFLTVIYGPKKKASDSFKLMSDEGGRGFFQKRWEVAALLALDSWTICWTEFSQLRRP